MKYTKYVSQIKSKKSNSYLFRIFQKYQNLFGFIGHQTFLTHLRIGMIERRQGFKVSSKQHLEIFGKTFVARPK